MRRNDRENVRSEIVFRQLKGEFAKHGKWTVRCNKHGRIREAAGLTSCPEPFHGRETTCKPTLEPLCCISTARIVYRFQPGPPEKRKRTTSKSMMLPRDQLTLGPTTWRIGSRERRSSSLRVPRITDLSALCATMSAKAALSARRSSHKHKNTVFPMSRWPGAGLAFSLGM